VALETIITDGLVLRQTNYDETHRILTIFTRELGVVSAIARGVRKHKSHQGGAAQFLCYSQFTLCKNSSRSDMYALQGASLHDSFYDIGSDIVKLSLANYLCDITAAFAVDHSPEPEILRLLLNTLYILAKKDRPLNLVKAVYELRLMTLAGFGAEVHECIRCQNHEQLSYFSPVQGGAVCALCNMVAVFAPKEIAPMPAPVRAAIDYIGTQDENRIFAFDMPQEQRSSLEALAEAFLLAHADKRFASLDYYRKIYI